MTARRDEKLVELRSHLVSIGVDPDKYRDLLLVYCDAFATWQEAVNRIEGTKPLTKSPRDGVVVSPWVTIKDGAAATMDKIGRQLGLSPDHRPSRTLPEWDDYKATSYR